jgi:hypothetical protein
MFRVNILISEIEELVERGISGMQPSIRDD